DESDITPHPLPAPPAQVTAASPPVPIQRELWPLFVLVAAVLLALEGVLYWRRQTGGRLRVPSVTGDQWALALRGALVVVLLVTPAPIGRRSPTRSEEHTSELQSRFDLVCRLLLEKKKKHTQSSRTRQIL